MKIKVNIEPMSIVQFYDCVAIEMGYADIASLRYDCTKIDVACNIQELIFEHYKSLGAGPERIGMNWVLAGPKTDESLGDFEVVVDDGFICRVEHEAM